MGLIVVPPRTSQNSVVPFLSRGTKVIRSDKNAALLHQCHHLIWGGGGIKQTRYTRVNRYLMAEVIQRIQQW